MVFGLTTTTAHSKDRNFRPPRQGQLRCSLDAACTKYARLGIVALSFLINPVLPAMTLAQETSNSTAGSSGGDPWSGVEEMIVTGGAGIAALLDTSSSAVAFDKNYLEAMGALDISDLAEYTPNLEINSPYAASNPQLFIRGVGLQDSNSNASAAVAVVVDNVYLNSPAGQLAGLFDVDSVEVLRGPQGSFYGRNASAGVVRVNSARPVHSTKAGANITYGRFNQQEYDGFLNLPIIEDVLATRFSFKYTKRDPLGENRCYEDRDNPFPAGNLRLIGTKCRNAMVTDPLPNSPVARPPKDTHDRENWFARSTWLLEPMDDLSFVLKVHGGQNLGLAPQFQNRGTNPVRVQGQDRPDLRVTSRRYIDYDTCHAFQENGDCLRNDRFPGAGDPYSGDYGRGGKERLTLGGLALNSNWTSGPWTLTSVTGLDYNDREVVVDFDASPYVQADAFITDDAWQVLEDVKLVWDDEIGVLLTVGAQYFQEELESDNLFWNNPGSALSQQIEQKTVAAAGFGYVEFELSETLTLEGGARANYERKNFAISTSYNGYQNDVFLPPRTGFKNRRELSEQVRPSGEIIMRWEPTDDINFYGRFTRGHKGRHFNGNTLTTAQNIKPVRAESISAFEVGWGANFLDGLVSWNGAGFYYDYEDQQVYQLQNASGISVPVPILINAKDSRLVGMESDVKVAWEGIEWFNSVGIIYSEYSDFKLVTENISVSTDGVVSISLDVDDYSGNSLVNAPELTLVGYLSYVYDLPTGGSLIPRIDYRYKSQVFYTPQNDSRIGADPRWLFDVRLDYKTPGGNIGIAGWVRNVTDEYFAVTGYDRKDGAASIIYVVSEPRTYGLTLSLLY